MQSDNTSLDTSWTLFASIAATFGDTYSLEHEKAIGEISLKTAHPLPSPTTARTPLMAETSDQIRNVLERIRHDAQKALSVLADSSEQRSLAWRCAGAGGAFCLDCFHSVSGEKGLQISQQAVAEAAHCLDRVGGSAEFVAEAANVSVDRSRIDESFVSPRAGEQHFP